MKQFACLLICLVVLLSGCTTPPSMPGRYITKKSAEENRTKQIAMAPRTMAQLRKYGVTHETELKLEFFFYTNSDAKAAQLAQVLNKKGYAVERKSSAQDGTLQLITGWTPKMRMTDAIVIAWTREMCELGYSSDCEFDGWGTNPP